MHQLPKKHLDISTHRSAEGGWGGRGWQGKGDALPTLTYVRRQPSLEYHKAPPHYYSPLRASVRGCAALVLLRVLNLTFPSPHSQVLPAQLPLIRMHA